MSKKVNLVFVIVLLTMLTAWYFGLISMFYITIIALVYLTINILGAVNISYNYFFYSHCKSQTQEKIIAITFDDGPHPDITPVLIDLLDQKKIPATFFCIGKNASSNPEIIARLLKNNHIIANHSFVHSNFFDFLSPSKMQKEIFDTNITIQEMTGKAPLLFRPPYGITNPLLRKALKNTGMISIGWSLRSLDTVKSSDKVLAKLKAKTKAGDIILFHDTNPNIISIIEEYLTWLQKNEFKIVSLTKLLNIKAYAN